MGKATRWLRVLFGLKRPDPNNPNPNPNPNPTSNKPSSKDNRRRNKWSLVKPHSRNTSSDVITTAPSTSSSSLVGPTKGDGDDDASSKHAIAVAAATAAVAEAAVAAAHAAAAVVRLTSGGGCGGDTCHDGSTPTMQVQVSYGGDEEDTRVWAAVVIQSYFRSYLARRALRALKGLVKLQALVRGHIMRKKTKETMLCMQAMLRAQARARSVRASSTESPHSSTKSSHYQHPGPPTPEKFELVHAKSAKHEQTSKIRRNSSKTSWSNIVNPDKGNFGSSWSDPRMDEPTWDHLRGVSSTRTCLTDDERGDRILEVDPGKPFFNIKRRNLFESSHSGLLTSDHITQSYITSKDSTHQTQEIEDRSYCTAENSPQYYSSGSQGGGSRRGPFTPAKSDGSRSFLGGYSDCPSYMAYTESAKAKMRSHSAPKQRPQYERASSINKRYSVHGFGEHNPRSNAQRASTMQASFTSKAYPGSGRLDRLGMPVRDSTVVYYSGYLN